jgi:Fur family ferric uptake transcriptional regulator
MLARAVPFVASDNHFQNWLRRLWDGPCNQLDRPTSLTSHVTRATVPAVRAQSKSHKITADALERGMERFRIVLRARELKMSKVRESVASCALQQSGHFSVEDLVKALHVEGVHEAHMATVYRAMPLLVEAGLVQATLISPGDSQYYEVVFEREHHDHLVCSSCGRVVEYRSEALLALQREIAARYEFELEERVSELHGKCKDCRRAAGRRVPRA